MRRRRPHLTVSLFPFISVLLCTLGALILLLLVLDQSARQQHQLKLNEESTALARERREAEEEIAARRHAWLQQHRLGLEEEFGLQEQAAHALQGQKQERDQELAASRAALATSTQSLHSELAQTERFEKLVAERSRLVQPLATRQAATLTERERLLGQVRQLEGAVNEMQAAARQKGKPLFALVPYRGKQGTKRRPIYLEGVGNRLVFRPDGETLWPSDVLAADKLANCIASRANHLRGSEDESPYVLVLIRPSAINLYYDVLRAIDGANVDVGYELIDEDLQLDFSEPTPEQVAAWETQPAPPGSLASEWKPGRIDGARGGSGQGSSGTGTTTSGSEGRTGSVAVTGGARSSPGQGSGGARTTTSSSAARIGSSAPPSGVRGSTGGLGAPSGGSEGQATGVKKPVASSSLATTLPSRPPANGAPSSESPATPPGNQSRGPARNAPDGTVSRLGAPQGSPTPPQPGAAPPGQGKGGQTEPGEPPPPSLPAPKLLGQGVGPRPIGSSAAREFTIVVECLADGVRLLPDKTRLDPAVKGDNNPVLRAVTEQVRTKKKYAPDARPQLVFKIHPDGLRAYYHAAGALATLKIPSSWEIIESADVTKPQ